MRDHGFHLRSDDAIPQERPRSLPPARALYHQHRRASVTIHPDEQLLAELRERQQTPHGRTELRQRVQVEPIIGAELRATVLTGMRCCYRPEK
jgi:hypothetical protein